MKQATFEEAYYQFIKLISDEFERHQYILESEKLTEVDKNEFYEIRERKADIKHYETAIKLFSKMLSIYHEKNVVLLIDEYDVPLENAFTCGFYEPMINFIRSVLNQHLKQIHRLNLEFLLDA